MVLDRLLIQCYNVYYVYQISHLNLGGIYFKRKEYNKAIKKYERVIELNPTFADAYFNLGIVYRLNGKLNKVKELFEKAIELNPGFKERIEKLGWKM